jgi:hypothetical protein
LGATINDEQKTLFLASEKKFVLPLVVRRAAYNKIGGALDLVIKRAGEVIDPTLWSAPLSAWVITGLSGLPTKAIWPILYYWQIPLIVLALLESTGIAVMLAGLLPVFIINSSNINLSAALLVIPGVYLISRASVQLVRKWKTWASVVVVISVCVSWTYWIRNFFGQIEGTQRVDLLAYKNMYELYKSLNNESTNFVITNRLGPSDVMVKFYNGVAPENVAFEAFDWKNKPPELRKIYIGFTEEYGGNLGKVVGHAELPSEVVHLYGKDIWAMER